MIMMAKSKLLLCFVLLLVVLFAEADTTAMHEKILSDRSKKVIQLEYALASLEKQIENHKNGVKVLEDQRLKSLKTRMNSYKAQIFEASRGLSQQEIKELIITEEEKNGEL
ncbi:hypothetical protein FRACYDRAFT_269092 [Fragilariopsis cylindrus CCMP1102]|uniref:Uncharacterized protein n=1 Tax=Fragilariopsis cylindrus CCMP1102 TaxID=635003 RepID=A0A1E7FFA8_9STRA|nr:hypothetical protein FRACYDRAFT_269092 [Fragilariopsis cylindrus CCMP1102]|eukprot:OEU16735.1 hypothetical protein FRACYDRAFT_269092 [Fragilariopsis cylindrus CCMP1102]